MPAQEIAGSPNLGLEPTIRRRTGDYLVRFVIPITRFCLQHLATLKELVAQDFERDEVVAGFGTGSRSVLEKSA